MAELAIECTRCAWIRIGGMGNGVREGRCPVYITQIGTACGMWSECPDTLSCAPNRICVGQINEAEAESTPRWGVWGRGNTKNQPRI